MCSIIQYYYIIILFQYLKYTRWLAQNNNLNQTVKFKCEENTYKK